MENPKQGGNLRRVTDWDESVQWEALRTAPTRVDGPFSIKLDGGWEGLPSREVLRRRNELRERRESELVQVGYDADVARRITFLEVSATRHVLPKTELITRQLQELYQQKGENHGSPQDERPR